MLARIWRGERSVAWIWTGLLLASASGCVVYVQEPSTTPRPEPVSPPPPVVQPPIVVQPPPQPAVPVTPLVVVPSIVGQPFQSAEAMLMASQLELGNISYRQVSLPPGTVVDQEPDAGSVVPAGTRVSVVLAIEQAQAVVPDVIGKGLVQATIALRLAGLRVGQVSFQSMPGVTSPRVGSQSPMAGSRVPPGTEVSLVVYNPSPKIAVPDLSGQRQIDAIRLLNDVGLRLGSVSSAVHPTVPEGCVVSQTPPAGTLVDPGSTVSLVISSGAGLVVVPSVVGQTVPSAIAELLRSGLRSHVDYRPSPGPPNRVLSQDPVAGARVERLTVVRLVASKAMPEAQTVTVPDIVGERPGEANALLAAAGLAVGDVTRGPGKPGVVVSQNPPAGTNVPRGSKVSYVVGALIPIPPQLVTVPNVVGMKLQQAELAIRQAGLELGSVRETSSPRPGEVLSQNPSGGTQVVSGTKVELVVGRHMAPKMVAVPNVVGMLKAQAEVALREAGLNVGELKEVPGVREGEIVAQVPAAGTQVHVGSKVNLTVSRGQAQPNMAIVPNVVGMKLGQAQMALRKAGLELGTVTEVDGREPNEVVSQSPPPMSQVPAGTKVNVSVVRPHPGPQTVTVPNVVGMKRGAAEAAIRKAELEVGTITEVQTGGQPNDVIAQSPQAGSQVPKQTKVNLTVVSPRGGGKSEAPGGQPEVQTVTVPNVVGMGLPQAKAVLKAAGLEPVELPAPPTPGGKPVQVGYQTPPAGSKVAPGTKVTLSVAPEKKK